MPTQKAKKMLKRFQDHEDQDRKDLAYGGQKDACQRRSKPGAYEDSSLSGDWKPEED